MIFCNGQMILYPKCSGFCKEFEKSSNSQVPVEKFAPAVDILLRRSLDIFRCGYGGLVPLAGEGLFGLRIGHSRSSWHFLGHFVLGRLAPAVPRKDGTLHAMMGLFHFNGNAFYPCGDACVFAAIGLVLP